MQLVNAVTQYDPMLVDTSFVEVAANKIPKDGHIGINEAEQLATIFLEAADKITDEIARCSAYVGFCEAERREAKSSAIDGRITGTTGPKVAATIAAQLYGNDDDYKKAHERQALGEAFLDWLRSKCKNLMAAHVLCKDILKIHHAGREQGNWRSARPHDIDDEPEYDNSGREAITSSDDQARNYGADKW